ncbi:MAG: polymer-forming cytoskeletal protein [Angelakisella sp.]|jgi:cytoskeletal protein CcmA (bactofilin family)|nr:polymer-forming cytoskeletal protein [Angelakisella sp.]MCI9666036.1 polymer-forming cytoskeletal protein [Angelakisella sp.]
MAMFKKNRNLGGIIQVGDNDEDIMDSVAGAEDSMGGEAVAPVKEDVWDTDEEKAAKREVQEQSTVIGKAALITGDLTAKGPITVAGVVQGNVSCESKVCVQGEVTGNIVGKGILVTTGGKIRGNVSSSTDLVLQVGSAVEGDMDAAEMTLEGAITGNLNCGGNLTLGAKSVVTGDISTKDITTTLGAHINGRVEMKKA